MSKKAVRKRIERLEALAHAMKIEDAKRRYVESFAKMTDEEMASFSLAVEQLLQEEDLSKVYELFRSGLATAECLEERGWLGWRAYCETGGQKALVYFCEAHEDDEGPATRTPGFRGNPTVLFEGVDYANRRIKGINFHRARLTGQAEKKAFLENDTPSWPM